MYHSKDDFLFFIFRFRLRTVLYLLGCLIKGAPFLKLLFCAIVGGDGVVPYHKKGDGERKEGRKHREPPQIV